MLRTQPYCTNMLLQSHQGSRNHLAQSKGQLCSVTRPSLGFSIQCLPPAIGLGTSAIGAVLPAQLDSISSLASSVYGVQGLQDRASSQFLHYLPVTRQSSRRSGSAAAALCPAFAASSWLLFVAYSQNASGVQAGFPAL